MIGQENKSKEPWKLREKKKSQRLLVSMIDQKKGSNNLMIKRKEGV